MQSLLAVEVLYNSLMLLYNHSYNSRIAITLSTSRLSSSNSSVVSMFRKYFCIKLTSPFSYHEVSKLKLPHKTGYQNRSDDQRLDTRIQISNHNLYKSLYRKKSPLDRIEEHLRSQPKRSEPAFYTKTPYCYNPTLQHNIQRDLPLQYSLR